MSTIRRFAALAFSAVLASLLAPAVAPAQGTPPEGTMFTLTWNSNDLYTVDPATAAATFVGTSSVDDATGIVWDPATSQLYGFDWVDAPTLSTIDPDTGASTSVGPMNVTRPTGVDIQPSTGTAFIVYDTGGLGGDSTLATLDLATAEATDVGPVVDGQDGLRISGIAFDPTSGALYGLSYDNDLYEIDPATGAAALLFEDVTDDTYGLAFDCAGTLYAADQALYTIDLSTGASTEVGAFPFSTNDFVENLTVVCNPFEPTTTTTAAPSTTTTTVTGPAPAPVTPAARPVAAAPRFTG